MGVSRSASTVIAYAMKEFGWTLEKAYNYVKQKRSITRPNAGFMRQLSEYEGILDARWVTMCREEPTGKARLQEPCCPAALPSSPGLASTARNPASGLAGWRGARLSKTAIVWGLISGFQEGSVLIVLARTESSSAAGGSRARLLIQGRTPTCGSALGCPVS